MSVMAIDPAIVTSTIDKRLDTARQHVGKGFRIAPDTTDLFKRAMERARAHGRKTIEATDIFEALAKYDSLFVDVMRTLGASPDAVADNVRVQVERREQQQEQYKKNFDL